MLALGALFACGVVGPARAHPHIFIEAGLRLETGPGGAVTTVEVTWRYDEFYTLLLLQDFALDTDFDGALTEAERAATLGFDLNWNGGFEGGLYLWRGDRALTIGPPVPVSMTLRPDGRLETVHRRPVTGDIPEPAPLSAQIYDEAFYIAFDPVLPSGLFATSQDGAPSCRPELVRADLDAAYAALDAQIAALGGIARAEADFPPVGALFADRLVFPCAR